jgi:CRISPR/Cas system-associated exonuclease Cas4 (RecB family)
MQRFLESCASYVFQKFSNSLADLCIVVPNRRSGVFFNAYLRKQISHPVIGPRITTINEWMLSFSNLFPADRLLLIAELYEVFRKETGTSETFDDFYFWGEVLLADFDDVDKYGVDASDLFKNLLSVKEIDNQFDYLSDEQKAVIRQFWGSLKSWEDYTHEKEFVSVWEKLYGIYSGFREKLAKNGKGYPGMIILDGLKNLDSGKAGFPHEKYIIIGMNALNHCEKRVFSMLQKSGKGLFLWDYDNYYVENRVNNAGKFLRENLQSFPAPEDFILQPDSFRQPKKIELVAVPSLTGQSQVIPGHLANFLKGVNNSFDNTAIVLADESLLFPVLGAIPAEAGAINVTMGYPVKNSPVVSLLYLIAALIRNTSPENTRKSLYYRPVLDILSHQLLKDIEPEKVTSGIKEIKIRNIIYLKSEELYFSDIHKSIFNMPSEVEKYCQYFLDILRLLYKHISAREENRILTETIHAVYQALEKLQLVVTETLQTGKTEISSAVFFRLMMQHLNQVTVPFEGEPLSGIQVMGILETRCLDFDNLIIVGLNEDIWPRSGIAPSMIPYNLRKGFGLPGIDDQDAMYAYYFYRLMQRSTNITATWNTIREATSGGELSRFGFQLILNSPHKVVRSNFDFPFLSNIPLPVSIHSDTSIAGSLLTNNQTENALSPSAINTFLQCKLKFYFRYVTGLKEEYEVTEEISRMVFGNIFHKAMETIYHPFTGKLVSRNDLKEILRNSKTIEKAVLQAFDSEYFKTPVKDGDLSLMDGKSLLIKSTIESYIRNLLEFDMEETPFTIHSLEKEFETTVEVKMEDSFRKIRIGGKVDRVDETAGIIRVVDYKTGSLQSASLAFRSCEELFDTLKKNVKKESIQSLIYAYILHKERYLGQPVSASVFSILNLKDPGFNMAVRMNSQPVEISVIENEFYRHLQEVLSEIYSPATVFSQTEFPERCQYCPYQAFCRKG